MNKGRRANESLLVKLRKRRLYHYSNTDTTTMTEKKKTIVRSGNPTLPLSPIDPCRKMNFNRDTCICLGQTVPRRPETKKKQKDFTRRVKPVMSLEQLAQVFVETILARGVSTRSEIGQKKF